MEETWTGIGLQQQSTICGGMATTQKEEKKKKTKQLKFDKNSFHYGKWIWKTKKELDDDDDDGCLFGRRTITSIEKQ